MTNESKRSTSRKGQGQEQGHDQGKVKVKLNGKKKILHQNTQNISSL